MAYINQEAKKIIVANLKKVVPTSWKWSVSIRNHSTICFTVASAPVDLIAACNNRNVSELKYLQVNHYHLDGAFDGEILEILEAIKDELNRDNFDKSDSQTDYFHVGHYISMQFGKWDKPFLVK